MWPDQISNPGPLNYKSGALLTALHGPAILIVYWGSYFLALTRKINLVSEICAHWGRRGVGRGLGLVVVVLLFYVHGKHLRSCRDGQLT